MGDLPITDRSPEDLERAHGGATPPEGWEAERAEAIDHLAGSVAHEFSNLLTAMTGQLELLLDLFPQPCPERQLLLDVRTGAESAGRITRQLQAISARQAMQAEPTDLNAVIQESSDVLQQIAGGGVEVRFDLAGGLPLVSIDARLVRQVVFGLVAASRDGLAGDGRITVRTAVDRDLFGPSVLVSVADTRVWTDDAFGHRAFEPTTSTGRQPRGAGLSLAAVRGTVRQCGGTIACERQVPSGVAFVMRLPQRGHD